MRDDMDAYCKTLTGSGFSPTHLPNILNAQGGEWLSIIFLGLMGSAALMAFVYMISKAMRIPRLEGWTRHEMFQILATAGLAILITTLTYGMCAFNISFLSNDLYGGAGGQRVMADCGATTVSSSGATVYPADAQGRAIVTPYCAAKAYLTKIKDRGEVVFVSMVGMNAIMTQMFRLTYESRPLGIGYTLEPLAGLQQIQNVFLVAVSGFMISYLSVIIQIRILDYMVIAAPYFFMPLGLLLRCFAPTREFGGALMGFCFASLLMFPIILAMNDVIIYSSLDEVTGQAAGINQELYPPSTPVAQGLAARDLSGVEEGDRFPIGSASVEVAKIYDQSPSAIFFQARGGYNYLARLDVTSGGRSMSVHRIDSRFDAAAAGARINQYWGMYEPNPNQKGEWQVRTTSSGTPVRYFTDPDPSAPNEMVGLASKRMTTGMIWPVQMFIVYSVAAILLPIINFMIYIEVARGLTTMLGAEMDLSNLTRMI